MRNLVLVFLLFLLALGGLAALAWQRTGRDRYAALEQQGIGLARILRGAALEAREALRTAEDALALRLQTVARRIDDSLARTRGSSVDVLQGIAEEEGVGRVFLFNASLEPVSRARTPAPLPTTPDALITAEQKADLEWTEAEASVRALGVGPGEVGVEGLHSNVFGTRDRFGVAFGRPQGGVLLLRANAHEIAALRRRFGVEPLLERAVELPDVLAVLLADGDGQILLGVGADRPAQVDLPPGFEVDAASWPVPAWHKAEGAWTIVYEPEVLLVFRVWAPKTLPPVAELSVRVDWLVCHDAEGCIPGHAALALRLPRSSGEAAEASVDVDAFDRGAELLPDRGEGGVTLRLPFVETGDRHPDTFRGVLAIRAGGRTSGYAVGWSSGGEPIRSSAKRRLEVVTTTDRAVGNIAFADDGDLIVSFHPFFEPDIRVARLDPRTGTSAPFPNRPWNTPREGSDRFLDDVLGLRSGADGVVWLLDMGTRNDVVPKLVAWDTRTDELRQVIRLPGPATLPVSQPNDFVIDGRRERIVIADEGIARGGDGTKAALIVVDTSTGKSRRVLQGHASTRPDPEHPLVVDGKRLEAGGRPVLVGADGITLDAAGEWLYFGPLNGDSVYRVRMADVADEALTDEQLGERVERFCDKPNNGGLSIDVAGNLYFTNVESRSIGFVSATRREYSVLTTEDRMLWPDGISCGKDGWMYVSAAQVHLGAPFNDGRSRARSPFYVFRFKPVADGIFGR